MIHQVIALNTWLFINI